MFKGVRGFLYVGGYMVPIIAALMAIYVYHKTSNNQATIWAGLTIMWIINSFLNSVIIQQWKELYTRSQKLCDEMIAYIRSQQEVITNDDNKEKDSKESK